MRRFRDPDGERGSGWLPRLFRVTPLKRFSSVAAWPANVRDAKGLSHRSYSRRNNGRVGSFFAPRSHCDGDEQSAARLRAKAQPT
jgi:hypothetical protein